MSITEHIKFIGKRRETAAAARKRANIGRPLRVGTPLRVKTLRRLRKQILMGLSGQHKEVFVPLKGETAKGFLRHPTKNIIYGIAIKVEHPDPEAAKISAPFYAVIRQQLPRNARHTKDQRRQCHVE